jgi:hypothetical protein
MLRNRLLFQQRGLMRSTEQGTPTTSRGTISPILSGAQTSYVTLTRIDAIGHRLRPWPSRFSIAWSVVPSNCSGCTAWHLREGRRDHRAPSPARGALSHDVTSSVHLGRPGIRGLRSPAPASPPMVVAPREPGHDPRRHVGLRAEERGSQEKLNGFPRRDRDF